MWDAFKYDPKWNPEECCDAFEEDLPLGWNYCNGPWTKTPV